MTNFTVELLQNSKQVQWKKFQDKLNVWKWAFIHSFAIYMIVGLIWEKNLLKCVVENHLKFEMNKNN